MLKPILCDNLQNYREVLLFEPVFSNGSFHDIQAEIWARIRDTGNTTRFDVALRAIIRNGLVKYIQTNRRNQIKEMKC
jgi:hypothetical protein